jgi:hypothetical protein
MANITSYRETESLASNDLFIISDASEANSTKSVKLSTLSTYIGSGGGGGGTGTVTSVTGTGSVSGITLSGTVTESGSLTLSGALAIDPADITSAIGYTPYNASNPDGFTSFAEPAIFSGGGTPTLASGVTAEQIRTLIGSGSGGEGTNLSGQLTSTTVRINSSTGNDVTIAGATGSIAGVMTAADKTKLDNIGSFDDYVQNSEDIYTSSSKITQIISLTQAEYDSISTKDSGTLYIIL